MNDVVDCIMISRPQIQIQARGLGKEMVWDKLPPFEEGTDTIDFSLMTEDPLVEGGYYCAVSVINGTDENGRTLFAEFSVKAGTDDDGEEYSGWSIVQGIRQDDGAYKVDGKSATLLLGDDVEGECEIFAIDKDTTISKHVTAIPPGHYIWCRNVHEDKGYYGHLDDGTIDGLHVHSDTMKTYAARTIREIVPTTSTTVTATSGEDLGPGLNPDGWFFQWYEIQYWSETTTTISYTYDMDGTEIIITVSGTVKTLSRYVRKWDFVHDLSGEVYHYGIGYWTGPFDVFLETLTSGSLPVVGDGQIRAWICDDVYYCGEDYSHPCLASWPDKEANSTEISLREDNKEMLFIDSVNQNIGFRDMEDGDTMDVSVLESTQEVGDITVEIEEYSGAKVRAVVLEPQGGDQ